MTLNELETQPISNEPKMEFWKSEKVVENFMKTNGDGEVGRIEADKRRAKAGEGIENEKSSRI